MDNNYHSKLLSWVKFNERVLSLATYKNNPLLERFKFLAITSSNLDEFFMIRIARILDTLNSGYNEVYEGGYTTKNLYKKLNQNIHEIFDKQYSCYKNVKKKLKDEKLIISSYNKCSDSEKKYLKKYFENNISPVLTPMAVDQARPFPLLLNQSLTLGIKLEKNENNIFLPKKVLENNDYLYAFVRVPSILPRLIKLPDNNKFIFIENIIKIFIQKLFKGHKILSITEFRVTKNADVKLNQEASDLLKEMQDYVNRRKWGFPVRLEINKNFDKDFKKFLFNHFDLPKEAIYIANGPIDLSCLMELYSIETLDNLKYNYKSPKKSKLSKQKNIFKAIKDKDYLIHRPYESFEIINQMIKKASIDPKVLAIKQTLYRVSGDSRLVKNLAKAAENGKQVTVLVELKARFDEKQNIQWAKKLEKSGCHVIYGFSGYKVHSKVLLIIREENNGINKYVHFSSGNYNDQTAKLYTDVDLITSNEGLATDASNLFNLLSGYNLDPTFNHLSISPLNLKDKVIKLINNEITSVKHGKKGYIIAKMNSLVDQSIIDELYKASKAGVKIDLIVRGMCCLKPNIDNLSENITVKSIVGKYLEHSRISYFYNDGDEKLFISSADWRPRNLYRRVEQMIPIYNKEIKKQIKNILFNNIKDNQNSWYLNKNGKYEFAKKANEKYNCQKEFFKNRKTTNINKDFLEQIKSKYLSK